MKTLFLRTSALALFFYAGLAMPVLAQTEGLQMQPAIIEDRAEKGGLFKFNLTVTNIGATEKTFFLSAQDIRSVDENGRPIFADEGETTGYELSSWVNLPGGSIKLRAGESRTIPFNVEVPHAASPGSHFAAIFFSDKEPRLDTTGSAISIRVGTIVSLRVAGEARDEARIREFSTGKIVYGEAKVDFNSRVENMGNVLVRPRGIIEITNMFGKSVASVQINDEAAAVFPAAYRIFSALWESDALAFGRYQAVLSFSYGEEAKKTISETTSFWILPLGLIGSVLGGMFLLIVGVFFGIKMYIRRKLSEMGGGRTDTEYYAQKYQRSGSRLVVIVSILFFVIIILLGVLFMMFA